MAYDHRAYKTGYNGSHPVSGNKEYMKTWWAGKRDRNTADAFAGAFALLNRPSRARDAVNPPAPPPRIAPAPSPLGLASPATQSYAAAATYPAASGGYYPAESRGARWRDLLSFTWWRDDSPIYRVELAGDALAESRWIKAIVGVICAIAALAFFFSRHDLWFAQSIAAPWVYGIVSGAAAAAGIWLLGKALILASYALAFIAFLLSWALLAGMIGGILYGSVVAAMRAGLIH